MTVVDSLLIAALAKQPVTALRELYREQGEFLALPDAFLPTALVECWKAAVDRITPSIHRNYIPGHKKGGSVGFASLVARAPVIGDVYQSAVFLDFLRQVVGAPVETCPGRDQHRCALYDYSRAGDRIGFHYDTSYYRGARYTVLFGVYDDSSARLVCRLHTRTAGRAVETREIRLAPGGVVIFNGDMLEHAVTPIKAGERRTVITMQYVTSGEMGRAQQLFSDLKDAVGYFGFLKVFLPG